MPKLLNQTMLNSFFTLQDNLYYKLKQVLKGEQVLQSGTSIFTKSSFTLLQSWTGNLSQSGAIVITKWGRY